MRWLLPLLFVLHLAASAAISYTAAETGLRIWIRDLRDRGVAGVRLTIIDANKQSRDVITDAEGVALATPLPGATVRIVGATAPNGQVLLMDENDRDGGLRIPLQADAVQALDLRITDGMLFVEPVAEAEDPAAIASVAAPSGASTSSTAVVQVEAAHTSAPVPSPEEVAQHSQWNWLRWLVMGVLVAISGVAVLWQVVTIVRARRTA